MKKSLIALAALAIIAKTAPKTAHIDTPILHLPIGEKYISVEWDHENGKTYDYCDGYCHETIFPLISAHICDVDGDCFDGIELSRTESEHCNIFGECSTADIFDFWVTKGEDDSWINIEIGF